MHNHGVFVAVRTVKTGGVNEQFDIILHIGGVSDADLPSASPVHFTRTETAEEICLRMKLVLDNNLIICTICLGGTLTFHLKSGYDVHRKSILP